MGCNVVKEYIDFQKRTLSLCIKNILLNYFDEELFNQLFSVYIDARYYDYYDREKVTLEESICNRLRKKALDLMEENSQENNIKIKEMLFCFNFILYLDEVKTINKNSVFINYVYKYRKKLLNDEDIDFKSYLLKFIEDNKYKKDKFINQFTCQDFSLKFLNTSKVGLFDVSLCYSLEFPKLYSDYAIDRVFNTGIINEDKLLVEYTFIALRVLDDVRACVFDKYYMVEFTGSLFEKKNKIENTLYLLDDDCIKDKVSLKIDLDTYSNFRDEVHELMRLGFSFAIFLKDKEIPDSSFLDSFEVFKFIVINNDSKYCHIMSSNDKIVRVDTR